MTVWLHKRALLLVFFIGLATSIWGRSERFRVMWREDPATSMVIGWDQVSGSNPRLLYDSRDHGLNINKYPLSEPTHHIVEAKMMRNHFVRLRNLRPNTVYYFVVVDSEGSSQRYSFKTAPADPETPLSIVAGGDSRNYRAARRYANRMVSKLRPDFIMFAGDMTGGDSGPEWIEWLTDWQETFGRDGRIFPIVVARGNHESSNKTLHQLFDLAHPDGYYAHSFGGSLLRLYTLNSMIAVGGDQRNWLEKDLQQHGESVQWRLAQYHHAMRPHTRAKGEKDLQVVHWAPLFFAYQIDLVLESDSHVVKWTFPIRPSRGKDSDEGFVRDDENGTVYIGEGCWGAPLRNNDDEKTWTRASGSFNQFKLIFVSQENIEVRTIMTDQVDDVFALPDDQRFILPPDFPVWKPVNGSVVVIKPRSTNQPALSLKPVAKSNPTDEARERSRRNVREWTKLPKTGFDRAQELAIIEYQPQKRGDVQIKVFDIYNQMVGQIGLRNRQPIKQTARIPLPGLREGVYLVSVKQGDKTLHYYQLLCE